MKIVLKDIVKNKQKNAKKQTAEKKPHVCIVCSKVFKTKFKLVRHSYIHLNVKPFVCEICNKGFGRKDHLALHHRVHTGENRLSCHVCAYSFKNKEALERHLLMRCTGKQEENLCPFCEVAFSYKSHLKQHFDEVHREYITCLLCGFTSSNAEAVHRHKKSHSITKPFSCLTCDVHFSDLNLLMIHECCGDSNKDEGCIVLKVVLDDSDFDDEENDLPDYNETVKVLRKFDRRGRKPKNFTASCEQKLEVNPIPSNPLACIDKPDDCRATNIQSKIVAQKTGDLDSTNSCGLSSQLVINELSSSDTSSVSLLKNDFTSTFPSSHFQNVANDNHKLQVLWKPSISSCNSDVSGKHVVCPSCKAVFSNTDELLQHTVSDFCTGAYQCTLSDATCGSHLDRLEQVCIKQQMINVNSQPVCSDLDAFVVNLSDDAGLTYEEINNVLGCSSAKQRLSIRTSLDKTTTCVPVVLSNKSLEDVRTVIDHEHVASSDQESRIVFRKSPHLDLRVNSHSSLSDESSLFCEMCGTAFYSARALNDHLNMHDDADDLSLNIFHDI